jgi:thioredoxin 1
MAGSLQCSIHLFAREFDHFKILKMETTSTKPTGNKSAFGDLINGDIPVLIDMFATWCGPCKMIEPAVKQVAQKMTGKIKVIKIDIDKNPHVARAYHVQGVPTLILFKKGKIIWRTSGVMPASQIEKAVTDAIPA